MEKTSKIKYGWLVTAMVVVLLVIDQIIKVYIKTHFCLGESVRVTDWFYIEFVENNGMAWGMSFIGKFWLSLLRLVAICALSIYLHRIIRCGTYRLLYIILVALVLTGAIGNMIDSIFYGLIFTGASPYYVSYLVPFGEGYAPVLMGKVVDMFRFPFFTYGLNGSLSGVDSMVHSSILYSILQIPVYQSALFLSCFSVEKNWKLSEVVIRRRRLKIPLLLKLLKKR